MYLNLIDFIYNYILESYYLPSNLCTNSENISFTGAIHYKSQFYLQYYLQYIPRSQVVMHFWQALYLRHLVIVNISWFVGFNEMYDL